jgi:hypothetical protein
MAVLLWIKWLNMHCLCVERRSKGRHRPHLKNVCTYVTNVIFNWCDRTFVIVGHFAAFMYIHHLWPLRIKKLANLTPTCYNFLIFVFLLPWLCVSYPHLVKNTCIVCRCIEMSHCHQAEIPIAMTHEYLYNILECLLSWCGLWTF